MSRGSTTKTHPGGRKGDKNGSGRRKLTKEAFGRTETDGK